jgi:hypothetical protein
MKKLLFKILLVTIGITALVGCRTAPVYNVEEASVISSTNKSLSMNDVKNAIIRGGASRGWSMKDAGKGHIVGTLHLRKHMAMVDIKYNTKSYSITYKDSEGLNYDGANVHQNYNGWVQNLETSINTQMSMM